MLKKGDVLPHFILEDQQGHEVDSASLVGDGVLIIYFYPKDFTPGCTREACSFRDNYQSFVDAGARVVGISADSVKTHSRFAREYQLEFQLFSDPHKEVHRKFGIPDRFFGLLSGRVTFVVDHGGVVREVFASQFQPLKHVSKALETVKRLQNT